jgi:predicted protein tyrosine phosphatase
LKLLFVCSANQDRSPTGEDIYKNQPGFEAKSAGTMLEYATVPISKELIGWADLILCMENHHRVKVLKLNPDAKGKTVVLNIPEIYYRGHPELVRLIKEKVSNILNQQKNREYYARENK